ncbi:putative Ig domain-containing protein [Candidatus Absconditicoccus praedator]|uniref:putative Ig domain-containing protein n=1 Tax=Candidatus Absconditicoccus praedator TaxID=2735562 RepID=UPI001E5C5022|nr:putative Ig domain-containing protein [Candidatus Absconditicoccus praedator]UFX83502.1 FIVAR domain-containing protein [Candidatus Absconditicoccus praedator]
MSEQINFRNNDTRKASKVSEFFRSTSVLLAGVLSISSAYGGDSGNKSIEDKYFSQELVEHIKGSYSEADEALEAETLWEFFSSLGIRISDVHRGKLYAYFTGESKEAYRGTRLQNSVLLVYLKEEVKKNQLEQKRIKKQLEELPDLPSSSSSDIIQPELSVGSSGGVVGKIHGEEFEIGVEGTYTEGRQVDPSFQFYNALSDIGLEVYGQVGYEKISGERFLSAKVALEKLIELGEREGNLRLKVERAQDRDNLQNIVAGGDVSLDSEGNILIGVDIQSLRQIHSAVVGGSSENFTGSVDRISAYFTNNNINSFFQSLGGAVVYGDYSGESFGTVDEIIQQETIDGQQYDTYSLTEAWVPDHQELRGIFSGTTQPYSFGKYGDVIGNFNISIDRFTYDNVTNILGEDIDPGLDTTQYSMRGEMTYQSPSDKSRTIFWGEESTGDDRNYGIEHQRYVGDGLKIVGNIQHSQTGAGYDENRYYVGVNWNFGSGKNQFGDVGNISQNHNHAQYGIDRQFRGYETFEYTTDIARVQEGSNIDMIEDEDGNLDRLEINATQDLVVGANAFVASDDGVRGLFEVVGANTIKISKENLIDLVREIGGDELTVGFEQQNGDIYILDLQISQGSISFHSYRNLPNVADDFASDVVSRNVDEKIFEEMFDGELNANTGRHMHLGLGDFEDGRLKERYLDGEYTAEVMNAVFEGRYIQNTIEDLKEGNIDNDEAIDRIDEEDVDKSDLENKIEIAKDKEQEDYTPDSWDDLQTVLDNAKNINEDEDATQDEVNQACKDLKDAIDDLIEREETPNQFEFERKDGKNLGEKVASEKVEIGGINVPVDISVQNGEYQINDGNWTDADGEIKAGDEVRVRHKTADNYQTETITTLEVGGVSAEFVSETREADVPTFDGPIEDQNIREGEGFELDVSGEFEGGDYDIVSYEADGLPDGLSINDDGIISGEPVEVGDFVVTVTAEDSEGNSVTSNEFVLEVKEKIDKEPTKFEFDDMENLVPGEEYDTDKITVSGINVPVEATTTRGVLIVNGEDRGESTEVEKDDEVKVRFTAPDGYEETREITVEIGERSETFSIETKEELLEPPEEAPEGLSIEGSGGIVDEEGYEWTYNNDFSWNPVSGADSYEITLVKRDGSEEVRTTTNTSIELDDGGYEDIKVRGVNEDGKGPESSLGEKWEIANGLELIEFSNWISGIPDEQGRTYNGLEIRVNGKVQDSIVGQTGSTSEGGSYEITGVDGDRIIFDYESPSDLEKEGPGDGAYPRDEIIIEGALNKAGRDSDISFDTNRLSE